MVFVFDYNFNKNPSDNQTHDTALSALTQAMFELDVVALVRKVYSRVSAPKLGVLTPE